MRVLFAITKGEIGGAQEHVRVLVDGLHRRGHSVGLVVSDPSELAGSARAIGAEVFAWPSIEGNVSPVADLRARRQLRAAIAAFHPDVLHLHSSKAGVLGRHLLRPPGGVTVFTCHHAAYGPGRKLLNRVLARPIEQLTLRTLDGIISVGARDVPLMRKLAPAIPITVIPNAVPIPGPPASPEHPVPVALWVARMQHPKDPIQAIRAWERVVDVVPEARLLLCGGGPLAHRIAGCIERSPARDNIEYLGKVPDLRPFQAQASVYLLATDVEGGTTMATLEALTQGLVPVMSDAGDAWLLERFGCGVIVPRRSPKAMAQAVIRLFRNPDELAEMRIRALRFARDQWTTANMVDSTAAFYERIYARSGDGDRRTPERPLTPKLRRGASAR